MANKLSVWETEKYYKEAGHASLDLDHPGIKLVRDLAVERELILDLGCGEGTRLSKIAKSGVGIDISETAIGIAKKNYPGFEFVVGDIENLPFADNSFDLVYSAFVMEHTDNPGKILGEVHRVLKIGSPMVIICPNYGAPNRSSPVAKYSRIRKLVVGFLGDLVRIVFKPRRLRWQKVAPIATTNSYESDWDTTIEPYAGSLSSYLRRVGFEEVKVVQTWKYEEKNAKLHQKIFRILGALRIYPFTNWSPHLVITAVKH